jgi:hypothetical protein
MKVNLSSVNNPTKANERAFTSNTQHLDPTPNIKMKQRNLHNIANLKDSCYLLIVI